MRSWFLVLLFLISLSASGQFRESYPYAFQKKDILVNFGLSLGHRNKTDYPNSFRRGGAPALSLTAEYGISRYISLGPYLSLYGRSFRYENGEESVIFHANKYYAGLRTSFHLSELIEKFITQQIDAEHLDVYITGTGGYKGTFFYGKDFEERHQFAAGGMFGLRYFVRDHWGLFAEAGYGPFEVAIVGFSARF